MRLWEKQFVVDQKTIKPLLYKIAGDMFVSKYRREVLEMKYIASHKLQDDESSTEEDLSHEELRDKYQKALNNLNEKQRTVFLMSRVEELKYKEIAERLGLSEIGRASCRERV